MKGREKVFGGKNIKRGGFLMVRDFERGECFWCKEHCERRKKGFSIERDCEEIGGGFWWYCTLKI